MRPGGLAERLYRLRRDARLTGDQLAAAIGWPEKTGRTKVSKIEHGKQMPSERDIRDWTEKTGHLEQAAELLELLEDVKTVHVRWRRRLQGGHAAVQEDIDRRTRAAKRIRNAELVLIPGLLQTRAYAQAMAAQVASVYGTDDVDAAVTAHMQRQEALYDGSKAFEFIVTEAALRIYPCSRQDMAAQLVKLQNLDMDLANVTLAVIPFGQPPLMPWSSFLMLDGELIVETYGGKDEGASAEDSALHVRIFDALMAEAVTGEEARRLIATAAEALRG